MARRERYRKSADAQTLHNALGEHIRDMGGFATGATRREVAELLADQIGNREAGKDADYMENRWVWSTDFVPMLVPTAAVHPVKIPSGRTNSRTVGPIVIDINHRGVKQIDDKSVKTDFVPPAVIIDGQHRWNDARLNGVKYMHAIVGTLALPEIHKAMLRHEHDHGIPKYSRRYSKDAEGHEHDPANGQFTSGGGSKKDSGFASEVLKDKWVKKTVIHIGDVRKPQKPGDYSEAEYKKLPIVYRGGDPGSGHTYITNDPKLAEYHGHVATFRIRPGAKVWADPEMYEELSDKGLSEDGYHALFKLKSGSGIIHADDLWPEKQNTKYSRRYAAPAGSGKKYLLGFEEKAPADERTTGAVCEHCRHFVPDGTKCGLFQLLEIDPVVKPDSVCKAFV